MDLSVIITLHNEGILAHATMKSIEQCLNRARNEGFECEVILVLDCASSETWRVAQNCTGTLRGLRVTFLDAQNKDLGLSRNAGVQASSGEYIAICDGDDYYSQNWFASALTTQRMAPAAEYNRLILHPEYVVSFGAHFSYARQVSRTENRNPLGLFADNWWCAWTIAHRSVFLDVQYTRNDLVTNGFGFEDWHWNCETIAQGFIHDIVPQTAAYYRRKSTGLHSESVTQNVLPRPSRLFARNSAAIGH